MKKLIVLLTVMMSIAWMDIARIPSSTPVWKIDFQYKIENIDDFPKYLFFDRSDKQILSKNDSTAYIRVLPKEAVKNDSFYIRLEANGHRLQSFDGQIDGQGFFNTESLFEIPFLQESGPISDESTLKDPITFTQVTFSIRFLEITKGYASATITRMEKRIEQYSFGGYNNHKRGKRPRPDVVDNASYDLDITYKNGVWSDKVGNTYPNLTAIYYGKPSPKYDYVYWILFPIMAIGFITFIFIRRKLKNKASV